MVLEVPGEPLKLEVEVLEVAYLQVPVLVLTYPVLQTEHEDEEQVLQ